MPGVTVTDDERAEYQRQALDMQARARAMVRAASAKRKEKPWALRPTPEQQERDAKIRMDWARGVTQSTIALRYGLSQTRISQIITGNRRSA